MNDWTSLIQQAREARRRAHAPYSRFAVGAALEDAQGRVWLGCNVESASYGLTVCAERVAVFSALAAGSRQFRRLVVVSPSGGWPCGACRQVLAELAPRVQIAALGPATDGVQEVLTIEELLPKAFHLDEPPSGAS